MNKYAFLLAAALIACGDDSSEDTDTNDASDSGMESDSDSGTDSESESDSEAEVEAPDTTAPIVTEFTLTAFDPIYDIATSVNTTGSHMLVQGIYDVRSTGILDVKTGEIEALTYDGPTFSLAMTPDAMSVGGDLGEIGDQTLAVWHRGQGWTPIEGGTVGACGADGIFTVDDYGQWGGIGLTAIDAESCSYQPATWGADGKRVVIDEISEGRINAIDRAGTYFGFSNEGGFTGRSPLIVHRDGTIELPYGDAPGEFVAVTFDGVAAGEYTDTETFVKHFFTWTYGEGVKDIGAWPPPGDFSNNSVMDICSEDLVVGSAVLFGGFGGGFRASLNVQGTWYWFDEYAAANGLDLQGYTIESIDSCNFGGTVFGASGMSPDGNLVPIVLQFPQDYWPKSGEGPGIGGGLPG